VLAKIIVQKHVDIFLFQCVKCMEIVQEHKALDDYRFFVELGRDEIEGGCTTNNQEKMKVIMCY